MRGTLLLFLIVMTLPLLADEPEGVSKRRALEARIKKVAAQLPLEAKPASDDLKERASVYFELAAKVKNYPEVGTLQYSMLASEALASLEEEMTAQMEAMDAIVSAPASRAEAQAADLAVTRAYSAALVRCQAVEKTWKKKGTDISLGRSCREVTALHRAWIAYREGWIHLLRQVKPLVDPQKIDWAVAADLCKRQETFLAQLAFK